MSEEPNSNTSQRALRIASVSMLFVGVCFTLLAKWLVPRVIEDAYFGRSFHWANQFMAPRRLSASLEHYQQLWGNATNAGLIVWVGFALLIPLWASPRFFRRLVGDATPQALGAIRALVCAIVLMNVAWENLGSTSLLPAAMREPMGLLRIVQMTPGFARFQSSEQAMRVFQLLLALVVATAMLGWKTRWTVPLAAVGYFIQGGILRQYDHFFHTGVTPLYLLIVLSFTPCGDGFSLDAKSRLTAPASIYGWSRFACWIVMVMVYVSAGLSKLRSGGMQWASAANLRSVMLMDTLNPMQFSWKLSLKLAHAPDSFFLALGWGTIAIEIAYVTVLFWPLTRRIMPIAAVMMHVGIWLLQNVLFYDLILLQLIFVDFDRWLKPRCNASATTSMKAPLATCGLAAFLSLIWAYKIEFYPLTSWQMYATPSADGAVMYYKLIARHRSGTSEAAHPEETIGAMADTRYRGKLAACFVDSQQPVAEQFFRAYAGAYNRTAPDQITEVEVQKWVWQIATNPSEPQGGVLADTRTIRIDDDTHRKN